MLRTFNHQNGVRVAYKPFCNRLARTGFEAFMREMCTRLIGHLRVQTLTPDGETAVARFTDIVIQDGSSFAIKRTLQGVFPVGSPRSNRRRWRFTRPTAASPIK